MTKATLEFDLDIYDDKLMFEQMQKASGYHSVIWDYAALLRQMCKHGFDNEPTLVTAQDMLEYLRDMFHEMTAEYEIRPFD